jgi:hypothetical protein
MERRELYNAFAGWGDFRKKSLFWGFSDQALHRSIFLHRMKS